MLRTGAQISSNLRCAAAPGISASHARRVGNSAQGWETTHGAAMTLVAGLQSVPPDLLLWPRVHDALDCLIKSAHRAPPDSCLRVMRVICTERRGQCAEVCTQVVIE